MVEKRRFDLDAELAALMRAEATAAPSVSDALRSRVLSDAADTAALRAAAPGSARAQRARHLRREGLRLRLFGLFDAWGAAAVGAVAVCLVAGIGVGYQAGDKVLAEVGFNTVDVARANDDSGYLLVEDIL